MSLAHCPTVVMIDHKGGLKCIFEPIERNAEYKLHRENPLEFQLNIDDFHRPGSPFPPKPPALKSATCHSLHIDWQQSLIELPGITQIVEVQSYTYKNVTDQSSHDLKALIKTQPASPLKWVTCVSKRWEYEGFTSHILEDLAPGMGVVFRLRYRNVDTWSTWSDSTDLYTTLPTVPSRPGSPLITKVFPDSCCCVWSKPKGNGSEVTSYELRGKSIGDDEPWVPLYSGTASTFYVTDLVPEFQYLFCVVAINAIGPSQPSEPSTVKLPRRPPPREIDHHIQVEADHLAMSDLCKEAWGEYFDQKTGKAFYFNKITGTRTQTKPTVLEKEDNETSEEAKLKQQQIEFRKKRFHFLRKLRLNRAVHPSEEGGIEDSSATTGKLEIKLTRKRLLWDTFEQIKRHLVIDMRRRLKVNFVEEEGIDSGGISKEFFNIVSKDILKEIKSMGLLIECVNDGGYYFASENYLDSKTKEKCWEFFHFVGRLLGKAIYDRQLMELPFADPLLNRLRAGSVIPTTTSSSYELFDVSKENLDLLDKELEYHMSELKLIDEEFHNSLQWMLGNCIDNIIFETFSIIAGGMSSRASGKFGGKEGIDIKKGTVVDLCLNGSKIDVTEANKKEYVLLVAQWRTTYSIIDVLEPLIDGFTELVPAGSLDNISNEELKLMISGRKEVDIEEIRAYTMYQTASKTSTFGEPHCTVVWLWDILREFDTHRRRQFLQFVTGSSQTPLDGYDPPFNVTEGSDMLDDSLPRAHTCFNQIVLPLYSSKEVMTEKLIYAFEETEGFGLT